MKKPTRVKALSIKGRACYVLRWKDRLTGKWRDETTEIPNTPRNRSKAAKAAADKEAELSGQRVTPYTWGDFEERYKDEWLTGKKPGTKVTWETAVTCLTAWARVLPAPADIDADALHKWAAWMRRQQYSEATIKSYLGILRAGLNWAADVGIVDSVPRFPRIAAGAKMGGRPITGEEFDRLLVAVPKVRKRHPAPWERLLRGLWLSGLRISEAVTLSWDWSAPFAVDLDASCFAIREQKSGKVEYAPMTPDFVAFLNKTPESERKGLVFNLPLTPGQASRTIGAIGKAAKVVTTENGGTATAHDLRRSFGSRWASKVHPAELQKLMRHADIATTMKFYVRLDSAALARKIALGEEKGELTQKPPAPAKSRKT